MLEKIQNFWRREAFYFSPDSYLSFLKEYGISVYAVECGNGTHRVGNSCALNVSLIVNIMLKKGVMHK